MQDTFNKWLILFSIFLGMENVRYYRRFLPPFSVYVDFVGVMPALSTDFPVLNE